MIDTIYAGIIILFLIILLVVAKVEDNDDMNDTKVDKGEE